MLRYPEGQPNRALRLEDREIVILPGVDVQKPIPKAETYQQRTERLRQRERDELAKITKIAEVYVEAPKRYGVGSTLTYARANDRVLRTLLRDPLRDTTTTERWFRDLRKEMDRLLIADLTLDPTKRSDVIDQRDKAMAKSMEQLLPFIEAVRKFSPGDILATGVELDVDLGIDLMRASPIWNEADSQLVVNIDLYQAKAGRVDEEGLRKLASDYQAKAEAALNLPVDQDWFSARGREQAQSRFEAMHEDELLSILSGAGRLEPEAGLSASGRFFQRTEAINQLNNLARQLGEPGVARPTVVLGEIDYRLLTRDSTGNDINVSIWDILENAEAQERAAA